MFLEVNHLVKSFSRHGHAFRALDDVSFTVPGGTFLGIVGESGSGKSTLSRILCGLEQADSGNFLLEGKDITRASRKEWRELYRIVQMIFQNPAASFHPRFTLQHSVEEGIRNYGIHLSDSEFRQLMEECHLTPELLKRYPHEVSGGECQRAACLRALCIGPQLLICDEITSAVDASLRLEIGMLIRNTVQRHGITCLFVTHDLLLAKRLCTQIIVLHQGKIVEQGSTDDVFEHPKETYTKELLASIM